jgi:hypothetical protein
VSDATPEHIREARRQQRDFDRIQNSSAAAVYLMGTAAAGVLSVYLAVAGAIGFVARDRSIVMGYIANDPPDPQFRIATRMRKLADISFSRVVDEPVAEVADEVIDSLTTGSAALRAMLRAAEREAGARFAKEADIAAERHEEALRYAERAADENRRYAVVAPKLAELLRSDEPLGSSAHGGSQSNEEETRLVDRRQLAAEIVLVVPRETLSNEVLSFLYRAGVPAGFLETPVEVIPEPRPLEALSERLRLSARSARRYSGYLDRAMAPELKA